MLCARFDTPIYSNSKRAGRLDKNTDHSEKPRLCFFFVSLGRGGSYKFYYTVARFLIVIYLGLYVYVIFTQGPEKLTRI